MTAVEVVGRGIKELVAAINGLEQLGVEASDLPLPKIVVVGDQSAGKSSVVEAISEIKVPRNSGTCTRAPLQINLAADDEPRAKWTCTVSLHKKYDFCNAEPSNTSAQKQSPFYPWIEKDFPSDFLFKIVHRKEELEEVLLRAQVATLNPGSHPGNYLSCTINGTDDTSQLQVEFSPNVVRLDISGPGLPNLAFYDLPGIINQSADTGKPYLVKLVRSLVKEYVRSENALVLLACSMEGDIATSSASSIVRKMGAEHRCIGVLTKPDRLPIGDSVDIWKSVLNGDKFRLGHEYYVTRQPAQPDLEEGITHTQARLLEREFFEVVEPWSKTFSQFKSRFGTLNLQTALSRKLTQQIRANLPNINSQVARKLAQIEHELADLPDPPAANSLQIVLEALNRFNNIVERHIEGAHPYNDFRHQWRALAQEFVQNVIQMRPTLIVRTPSDLTPQPVTFGSTTSPTKRESQETISILSDSEGELPTPSRKWSVPAKKRKLDATPNEASPQKFTTPQHRHTTKPPVGLARTFRLEGVRDTLEKVCTSDIPGEVDPKAVDHLRLESLANWDKSMNDFIKKTEMALGRILHAILDDVLSPWKATALYKETSKIVDDYLSLSVGEQRTHAQRALRLEQFKPMTMNDKSIEENEKKELTFFEAARYAARANSYLNQQEAMLGKRPDLNEVRTRKIQTDQTLRKELGVDPFQREVGVMAKVRGYYNVASMRFVDHVVQGLQAELFERCRTHLHEELKTGLHVDVEDGSGRCTHLLAEDSAREARRIQLKKEKERLLQAQEMLSGLSNMSA
ncbi:Dynamin family protein [Cryomyces antarcticus]